MAEFKNSQPDAAALTPYQKLVAEGQYEPFGDGDPYDGGLVILHDDRNTIAEIRPTYWMLEPDTPAHARVQPLRFRIEGSDIAFDPIAEWDLAKPGLGGEVEAGVIQKNNGPWPILPDGVTLQFPDGHSQDARQAGFQAEMLKSMVETGTQPVHGYDQHAREIGRQAARTHSTLSSHGLGTPQLAVDPHIHTNADVSRDPWVQRIADEMEHILEFDCAGTQLHIDQKTPEAAAVALNAYQPVQALFAVLTEAAPIRDGSFDTSLADHYLRNPSPDYKTPPDAAKLIELYGADTVPHDYRQLSRELGSPSSGAFKQALPTDRNELLFELDAMLRSGESVSSDRLAGWHRDRWRPTMGTIEICNLATAGGNLHKLTATHSVLAKFLAAIQEYADETGQAPEELFGLDDTESTRQQQCLIAQTNNHMAAFDGKKAEMILPDGRDSVSLGTLLEKVFAITDKYPETAASPAEKDELRATLELTPTAQSYHGGDAETVIRDYFKPNSPYTANDAYRLAHAVEPERSADELQQIWAAVHGDHVTQWNRQGS